MSKNTKIWLIVAGCLVLAGLLLFTSVLTANGWDFTKLSTSKYETHTYTLDETFSAIKINTDTADVVFLPSQDSNCTVICYEMENANHLVEVVNGALCIGIRHEKEWYEYIGIHFDSPKITVYLPESEYDKLIINGDTSDVDVPRNFKFGILDISVDTGDVKNFASVSKNLKIKTGTGSIRVENVSAKILDLTVSTGDTYLSNVQCDTLTAKGSTGDIVLKNVLATGQFSIQRSTGDIKFEGCDADNIIVKTNTGDVTGSLLSEKIFITKTSTGKISVPQTTSGGKCEVTTTTGDIRLELWIG